MDNDGIPSQIGIGALLQFYLRKMRPVSFHSSASWGSQVATKLSALREHFSQVFSEFSGPELHWNRTTFVALTALALLWAVLTFLTWATWGNVTNDSGREMYVPAVLSEGKTLYRDVWYPYGPAAPYVNSFLFRLFGLNLNVLYWAGSLSALGSAVFLYFTGIRLSSSVVAWTVGAVVLLQAFQPSPFSFPLPYSFSSVYGCLAACLFLWLIIEGTTSMGWPWIFAAGTVAAIALLLKLEFGGACYVALTLLVAARALRERSWKRVLRDLVAILPGVALCVAVTWWMISIAGVDFITQENFMSWPTSFFMRTYGRMWLDITGFSITRASLAKGIFSTTMLAGIVLGFYSLLRRAGSDVHSLFLGAKLSVAGLAFLVVFLPGWPQKVFGNIFFPRDMVAYIAVAALAAWCYFWQQPFTNRRLQVALLFSFSSLLAFRMLLGMQPSGYAIYYNGPVVLSFLLLLPRLIIPQPGPSAFSVRQSEVLICMACLTAVMLAWIPMIVHRHGMDVVPLTTERGTIRVSKHMAENYQVALAFMKEEAGRGESVLSVPEDTSLYFLSATHCPTRAFQFTPGMLAPGKMTEELIREIEQRPTRYLIWSTIEFPEYGVPIFGTDYDRALGDYLRSHYRPVRPLSNNGRWNAVIWERKPEGESR